ncbi:sugar phosphate isomerase/epimerase family protein [Hwangdonia lutea]|uniref:Sugar phosphate isomerase/epimerase family protein n=1 Tax=Hwangdonia lutea TaxID=3075823 RepID=A0AA97ENA9_9FLAO|nr:sugar phosphate isomerase/epimerase family protein [Hwangdonia sp. SCSIO 19198]WOD43580.1 sugar phosphate isomerase/epimerase family protein [Hwangdonia sp. SCSIO 19198]
MNLKQSLHKTTGVIIVLSFLAFSACKKSKENTTASIEKKKEQPMFFKISLAQWSLHKRIGSGKMSPFDFAKEANALGFEAIEYVSGLYNKEIKELGIDAVVDTLKAESEKYGVKNLLIMVDGEGNLASSDENELNAAVENHKKWVDAAQALGCHSIRVNAHGKGTYDEVLKQAVIGLTKLSEYAKTKGINVLVENHGGFTSNGKWLATVMEKVNMPNCGTLPDFGNFCIKRKSDGCEDEYDKYKGVKELMPYAIAVSAKSYDFDEQGNDTRIDYTKMLQIVKDAGYTGFIGVEYEGSKLDEKVGILATKKLLLRVGKKLSN